MADKTNTETKAKSQDLLDTKFGTVDPASIVVAPNRGGKDSLTASFTTVGGKEIKIYAHSKGLIEEVQKRAAAGEPFLLTGRLLAKGAGLSVSSFDGKVYKGVIQEVGRSDEGWVAVKMKVEGRDNAWPVLLTGDDMAKAKVGETVEVNLGWVARQRERQDGSKYWASSAISAEGLKSPKRELETESPQP